MKTRITESGEVNDILRSISAFAMLGARCSAIGGVTSTETVDEPCDNAMAEPIDALDDTE